MNNRYSLNTFFNCDRKALYIILIISVILVFTLTIVYAALSTTLNINGNAEISAASWDIYLDNVQLNSQSATTTVPTISNKTTASFSTVLSKPGDFYEFTIDVLNDGYIDAVIDKIIKIPELTTEQAKYIKYEISYDTGEGIATKQLLPKSSYIRLKVRVEYRKDILASDLPQTSTILDLSFSIVYMQSDGEGNSVSSGGEIMKVAKVVSGNLNTVGSVISIGEEKFNLVFSNGNSIGLLADIDSSPSVSKNSCFDPLGSFWSEEIEYPAYVYNLDSFNYFSVDYYKEVLEELGVVVDEVRLISIEELASLGCSLETLSCLEAPEWIYSYNYFTGSAYDDSNFFIVRDTGAIFRGSLDNNSNNGLTSGYLRPLVVIPKSEF